MKGYPVFYYIRGEVKSIKRGQEYISHPAAVTVCIAESDIPGYFLRGVAICSAKDQPEKTILPFDGVAAYIEGNKAEYDIGPLTNFHGGRDWALRRAKRAERKLKKSLPIKTVEGEDFLYFTWDPINFCSKNITKVLDRFGLLGRIPFGFKTSAVTIDGLTDLEKKLLKISV